VLALLSLGKTLTTLVLLLFSLNRRNLPNIDETRLSGGVALIAASGRVQC
jgi:hypothetical protein